MDAQQIPEQVGYTDEDVKDDAKEKQLADGAIVQVVLRKGERRVQNPKVKTDEEGNDYDAGGHLFVRYQLGLLNPNQPGKILGGAPFLSFSWWMPLRNPEIEGHVIEDWVRNMFARTYEALDPDEYPRITSDDGTYVVRDESFGSHAEAKQAQSKAKLDDAVEIWGGRWKAYEGVVCYGTVSRDERFTNVDNLRADLAPDQDLTPLSELFVEE